MNKLTEKDLIELEFKRIDVTREESGGDPYYYYSRDIGELTLYTTSNDDKDLAVYLFDTNSYTNVREHLEQLINALNNFR